jgi:signal peptidase I
MVRVPRKKRRISGLITLVAGLIVVIVLGSIFAYLGTWPPMYVVVSNSMQHGPGDHVGDLNAGDIVLVRSVPVSGIVPYVVGVRSGYQTYGEPGDVLVYHPDGQVSATPVVHRAILFLAWGGGGEYNATALNGLPCPSRSTSTSYYVTTGTAQKQCSSTDLGPGDTLYLNNVGWLGLNLSVDFNSSNLGNHSGFLTLGDNNTIFDQAPSSNQTPLSTLVEPDWIIGVARGMIPWFGAISLALYGEASNVPHASWVHLEDTTVGIVLFTAVGLVLALVVRRGVRRLALGRRRLRGVGDETSSLASPNSRKDGAARPARRAFEEVPQVTRGEASTAANDRSPRRRSQDIFPVARLGPGSANSERYSHPQYAPTTLWSPDPEAQPTVQGPAMGTPRAAHEARRRSHFVSEIERSRRPPQRYSGSGPR